MAIRGSMSFCCYWQRYDWRRLLLPNRLLLTVLRKPVSKAATQHRHFSGWRVSEGEREREMAIVVGILFCVAVIGIATFVIGSIRLELKSPQ
jgi:hypothetical protein